MYAVKVCLHSFRICYRFPMIWGRLRICCVVNLPEYHFYRIYLLAKSKTNSDSRKSWFIIGHIRRRSSRNEEARFVAHYWTRQCSRGCFLVVYSNIIIGFKCEAGNANAVWKQRLGYFRWRGFRFGRNEFKLDYK